MRNNIKESTFQIRSPLVLTSVFFCVKKTQWFQLGWEFLCLIGAHQVNIEDYFF